MTYQYRITIQDRKEIIEEYPQIWSDIIRKTTERGMFCSLERRLVIDHPSDLFLDGMRDASGTLSGVVLNNLYIGEWELRASNQESPAIVQCCKSANQF